MSSFISLECYNAFIIALLRQPNVFKRFQEIQALQNKWLAGLETISIVCNFFHFIVKFLDQHWVKLAGEFGLRQG